MQELTKNWKSTQMVKRDRIKRDLQFEMVTEEIGTLKHTYKQQLAKKDEMTGIESFEKNMKKMGISTGDGENVRLSISYEAGDIYEKRLQDTVASKLPSNEEIQSFVNQLKDRTAEKRQARYEKARRRRRALTGAAVNGAGGEH
ncbi:hypothetical protein EON65_18390 [archaeon]|nr:MAG: hypothetical protein EON65_18390 [archaeon]